MEDRLAHLERLHRQGMLDDEELAAAKAAHTPASEETEQVPEAQMGHKRRQPTLAIAIAAVAVLGALFLANTLPGQDDAEGDPSASDYEMNDVVTPTIEGRVYSVLNSEGGRPNAECTGLWGGVDTRVEAWDEYGVMIGIGRVNATEIGSFPYQTNARACVLHYSIDVDEADFYTVSLQTVGGDGVTMSWDELVDNGWQLDITQ